MKPSVLSSSVLFVCTGNICRSPTAEAVFRNKINALGYKNDGKIDSAGIQGYHIGDAPDYRSRAIAIANGVSMDGITARKVTSKDFEQFDYIIAMDKGHFQALRAMASQEQKPKISLLLDFLDGFKGEDVPDPYYGTMADFENTYNLINQGIEGFLRCILHNKPD